MDYLSVDSNADFISSDKEFVVPTRATTEFRMRKHPTARRAMLEGHRTTLPLRTQDHDADGQDADQVRRLRSIPGRP
jgi:hypothetical protein